MKRTSSLVLILTVFSVAVLSNGLMPCDAFAQKIQLPKKKPVNPLNKVVNQILGKKKPALPPKKGAGVNSVDHLDPAIEKDAIDQRVPMIREQQSMLNSARTRAKLGQFSEALEILQNLLDQSEDSVIQQNDGRYYSIRWVTQREIAGLPEKARQFYEKTYGPLAKKMFDDAVKQSNFSGIRNVARRYFHTLAGYEAANRIASYHVDQGEFAIAARWYSRLEATNSSFVEDPVWRLKVGEVYKQSGLTESVLASVGALSAEQLSELQKRWPDRSVEEIRKQWQQYNHAYNPPLKDWLFPGGSLRRAGLAKGTAPLLLSNWQHAITGHPKVQSRIDQLLEDIEIANLPAIPMMQPITVGNRVVIRSLRGLKAIDTQTGETLWESREKVSAEKLLTGAAPTKTPIQYGRMNMVMVNGQMVSNYSGANVINDPLANLLFRNSVHNTLSSDGEHVFVIDRNAILSTTNLGYYYGRSTTDPYHRDLLSNRLTAYDLETGKIAWHVGGPLMNEPIDPPLAGTFFFGPPLTDGGELFVVGEKENAIRVYCLAAKSGEVLWSQLLAYTDAPIDRDKARRWWASQPAISEGVLICPTHIGLLVGIDRQSHENLWVSRYTKKVAANKTPTRNIGRRPGHTMANPGTIKDRWFATPPIIADQTVIYAPMEEAALIGFRLADGKERWRVTGLEQGLYPLGCYKSDLIVASEKALTGYNANTGAVSWKATFADFGSAETAARTIPSGRGLITGNQIMLPISGQEIWYFDLDKKKFSSRSSVADENLRLGNLVMADGKLISAGPDLVALFEPKIEVERRIALQLKENPRDPWALLKRSQVFTLDQQFLLGLAELQRIDTSLLKDSQHSEYRQQMFRCLIGAVRGHQLEFDEQFELLPEFIKTDSERQLYLRLRADRMLVRKDKAGAFEAYAELANYRGSDSIRDTSDSSLSYRQDVWLSKQLRELWDNSSAEVSSQIIHTVQKAVETAIASHNLKQMLHTVRIYGFHPDVEPIYEQMVKLAIEQKDYATAEFALNTMVRHDDQSIVASAHAQRAELLHGFGLSSDALYYLEVLKKQDPELVLLNGLTVGEWLQEKKEKNWFKDSSEDLLASSWSDEEFEVTRIGTATYNRSLGKINLEQSELPYFKEHRLHFDQAAGRLEIFRRQDDRLSWSIPLLQVGKTQARNSSNILPIRVNGHLITTYYKGMIQCYSLPDQRLVWSHPISDNQATINRASRVNRTGQNILQKARSVALRMRVNRNVSRFGLLVVSTSHTLCYLSKNNLVAIDPLNGEVRWTRRGVLPGTIVYSDEKYISLIPPQKHGVVDKGLVISTADGRAIETEEFKTLVPRGITVANHQMITIENQTNSNLLGINQGDQQISAVDLLTREINWKYSVDNDDLIGLIGENRMIIARTNGSIEIINMNDGTVELEVEVDEKYFKSLQSIGVISSNNQLLLSFNTSTSRGMYMGGVLIQNTNGYLVAIDRQAGKIMWDRSVKGMPLILEEIDSLPILFLGGMKAKRIHNTSMNMCRILFLDRRTGKPIFDKSFVVQQQAQKVEWSTAKKQLRLHVYQSIYSIHPKKGVASNNTEK